MLNLIAPLEHRDLGTLNHICSKRNFHALKDCGQDQQEQGEGAGSGRHHAH